MVQYHVTLNGQGLIVDLAKYSKKSAEPFAAKTATGDRSYGDLRTEQGLVLSDWSGGEGFLEHDPANASRFRSGSGFDVWTEPGSLRLGPHALSSAPATLSEPAVACVYKGNLYVGGGAGTGNVYRWDGASWTTSLTLAKAITALATFNGLLYAGNGLDGIVSSFDGATWTATAFTIPSSVGVHALATFYRQTAQYLYVAASRASTGAVYYWDGATLSALQYVFEEPSPRVALVLNNRLYFFVADTASRRMAVYSIDDAGSGGVYRAHVALAHNYALGGAVHDGVAYLGCFSGGAILSWDGSLLRTVRQVSGQTAGLRGLAAWNGALWVSVQDTTANTLALLRYDPSAGSGQAQAGWTRPVGGLSGTEPRGLAVYAGQLVALTQQASAATMHRLQSTHRASATLETSLFDARLPSVDKVARSLTVAHSALAAGQSVQVQYRLEDTGAWTTLGTSSTLGATSAVFSFAGSGVVFRQLAFRLVLAGPAGASASVILYSVLLRYVLSPELKREWELHAILEGTPEIPLVTLDGAPHPRTGAQQEAALWTAKGTRGPITLVDLDDASYAVWFDRLDVSAAEKSQRHAPEMRGKLRLVEA